MRRTKMEISQKEFQRKSVRRVRYLGGSLLKLRKRPRGILIFGRRMRNCTVIRVGAKDVRVGSKVYPESHTTIDVEPGLKNY